MEIALSLFGVLIGAAITWWAAKHYYEKASKDLAAEAEELKKLNTLMLRGLESAEMAKFSRDEEGNIKGMIIRGSGNLQSGSATISGAGTVISKKETT